jgi:hypothetical protein
MALSKSQHNGEKNMDDIKGLFMTYKGLYTYNKQEWDNCSYPVCCKILCQQAGSEIFRIDSDL